MRYVVFCFLVSLQTLAQPAPPRVVVYGGTAGGVMAAVAAAREGAAVTLVEPGGHLGGMLTGGLSHTDYGDRAVIGGLALDFYREVARRYQKPLYFWRGPEPAVGEAILRDWLRQRNVTVLYGERLKAVEKTNRQIRSVEFLSGKRLTADVFIDATYEGDLLARSGVAYAVGRESRRQYGESWAGRTPIYPDDQNFHRAVSPFKNGKNGELLPLINPRPMVPVGEADSAVQGYCFRLILTNNPANRLPVTRPAGYDSGRFELLRRYLKIRKPTTLGESGMYNPHINLPNQKAEINSAGPISTNLYDGSNWTYPDADYPLRDKIWADHRLYTHSLLYFAATDPAVPEPVRRQAREWGFCRDEFADTGYFPHQLYVRVARRMVGEYVLTQHDLQRDTLKYDAIGMGSYNMDIRHNQRVFEWVSHFPELRGETFNEGYLSIPVSPYEIPYRALLPKYEHCTNLLVPVCLSSSNLGYSSFRMEPQYMIAGHAAGVAAAMAGKEKQPVQRVSVPDLQRKLREQGQILTLEGDPNGFFGDEKTVVVDDDMARFVEKTGPWRLDENPDLARHDITFFAAAPGEPTRITYRPCLPADGTYRVYGWWPKQPAAATRVPLRLAHAGGTQNLTLNQRQTGDGWVLLGSFRCGKGYQTTLTLTNEGADGVVAADAFKFEWVP